MSQRIILVLTACTISHCHLYLRNITQAYVQSKTSLNREFFIRSLFELDLSERSIIKIIKPLYDVPETEAHWFNTYQKHHKNKLSMIESTFDSCLLHISSFDSCLLHISQISQIEFIEFINQSNFISHFEIVNLQTDDTLILADDEFVALEEKKLARVCLTFKKREKLNLIISIKFNDELIILANDENDKFLLFTQSKQFDQIKLINLSSSINLTSFREEIRKMITFNKINTFLNEHEMFISQRSRNSKRSLIFRSLLKLSISKRKTRSDWINVYNDK
jgi:hypothetical protein